MNAYKFEEFLDKSAYKFVENMICLGVHSDDKSKEEWMRLFLKWMEWETDMHDAYWKHIHHVEE